MTGNTIIVRVQAPNGTRRISVKPTERITNLLEKVKEEFDLPTGDWSLFVNRDKTGEITPAKSKTITSFKIKHGDMLYLCPGTVIMEDHKEAMDTSTPRGGSGTISGAVVAADVVVPVVRPKSVAPSMVVEDEVDIYLNKQDGQIPRQMNPQLCHHRALAKCLHCVPLEPYDETYLASLDPPSKFLSYHAYIRKLTSGPDKGKFVDLENLSCKIKPGCTEHPPWPGGICTKCQPNAVTLNRQRYRHVDYIQFENPFVVEQFLNFWRNSGNQRVGIMYGRYEHHKEQPLGIKAVVVAIYEPPQCCTKNSVELLEDHHEPDVKALAHKLGLTTVGWIFTDLEAEDLNTGTVKHFRGHMDAHFLSAEECITAADFQNRHPSPCKLSHEGHFGSKFVTVVISGDKSHQIHFEGYQVSNQCMALVNDDCLIPTKDAPELGYVKESSNEQYVPDVFYKEKDKYGNEITKLARPLPVEYLLVDLPAAFPVEPQFTFHANGADRKPFAIENREITGEGQDFHAFCQYMLQYSPDKFLEAMTDFHLLLYMSTCDMLPVKDHMERLCEAVKNKDEDLAHHWSKTEEWETVEQLMQHNVPSPLTSRQPSFTGPNPDPLPPIGGVSGAMWTCEHCTFLNPISRNNCDMCGLPH